MAEKRRSLTRECIFCGPTETPCNIMWCSHKFIKENLSISTMISIEKTQAFLLMNYFVSQILQGYAFHGIDPVRLVKIKQCWADISQPNPSDDITHKFLSSLALALPMKAVINNLTDTSSLAAKVPK